MKPIFKTWQKATYLKGFFSLRNKNQNRANPIDFPTVFTAYGKAIHSGNWKSCTSINTPDYVIKNYFDTVGNNKYDKMFGLWEICKKLEKISWSDFNKNQNHVFRLIDSANNELEKLKRL